jgi:hypothetical protein
MADITQVSIEENNLFMDDVKVILQIEHKNALGSDGFLAEFYQTFRDTIKTDLLEMFDFLHA